MNLRNPLALLSFAAILVATAHGTEITVTNQAALKAAIAAAQPGEDGAFFTIEGNLLERADGEGAEIISFKSNRNRAVIAHNTLVNNAGADFIIGGNYRSGWPSSQRILLPAGNIIANNLIVKTNGVAVEGAIHDTRPPLDRFSFPTNTFFGNVIHGGKVSYSPASEGFVESDAKLTVDAEGIYRPLENGPAVKAGVKFPGAKIIPTQLRRGMPGIGAEEFAATAARSKPLTPEEVGPQWIKVRRQAGEAF